MCKKTEPIVKEAAAFWANEMRNHPFPFYALQGKIGRRVLTNLHATRLRTNFEFTYGGKKGTDTFGLFVFVTARGSRLAVNAPSINLLVRGPLTNKHRRQVYATDWHRLVNFVRQFFGLDPLERKNNPLLRNLGLDENFVRAVQHKDRRQIYMQGYHDAINYVRSEWLSSEEITYEENPLVRQAGLGKAGKNKLPFDYVSSCVRGGRNGGAKSAAKRQAEADKRAAEVAAELKLPEDQDSCQRFLQLSHKKQNREVGKAFKKTYGNEVGKNKWCNMQRRRGDMITELYKSRVELQVPKKQKKRKLTN
eukprot:g6829.t1